MFHLTYCFSLAMVTTQDWSGFSRIFGSEAITESDKTLGTMVCSVFCRSYCYSVGKTLDENEDEEHELAEFLARAWMNLWRWWSRYSFPVRKLSFLDVVQTLQIVFGLLVVYYDSDECRSYGLLLIERCKNHELMKDAGWNRLCVKPA